jgi:CMP-N-acetylneuraminic acid synthetase
MLSALLTIGSHSERVPGKNWQALGGRPLYDWIVRRLRQWNLLAEIVAVVDAGLPPGVRRDLEGQGARLVPQPAGTGSASNAYMGVIAAGVDACKGDHILMTNVTNPFLRLETIQAAVDRFYAGRDLQIDSLEAVERMFERFYRGDAEAINFDKRGVFQRLQDLPPFFRQAQVLWLFSRESFLRTLPLGGDARVGERHWLFEVSGQDTFDIDTWDDLNEAECLLRGGLIEP